MPPLKLIENVVTRLAEGTSSSVAESASELFSEEASKLLGEKPFKILAPMSLRRVMFGMTEPSEETLAKFPRRIIEGSSNRPSTSETLSVDVLSADQLWERIGTEPANSNIFGSTGDEDSRRFLVKKDTACDQTHVTLTLGNRIVGLAGLQTNLHSPSQLWVQHVSVEAKHAGKGYASRVIESIYDYARFSKQKVVPSSFTADGQRLKHVFNRMDQLHPDVASGLPHENF